MNGSGILNCIQTMMPLDGNGTIRPRRGTSHWGHAITLVVVALANAGCDARAQRGQNTAGPAPQAATHGDARESTAQSPPAAEQVIDLDDKPAASSPIRGLSNDRFDRAYRPEFVHLDPRRAGWQSEAFSEQAETQLKRLGQWISNNVERSDTGQSRAGILRARQAGGLPRENAANSTAEAPPPGIVAEAFSCSSFRPEPLHEVHRGARFSVRRWTPRPRALGEKVHEGVAGLRHACQEILAAAPDADSMRVDFKVVGVQLDENEPLTEVRYQMSATTARETVQQNATWICRWKLGVDNDHPLLSSIAVSAFEEIRGTGPTRLFADCTESVFQDAACFAQQLALGLDHWRQRLDWRFGLEVIGAHGLAVGDVNQDGLDDVYVCESGGLPNRLLIQQPDGTVRDGSARWGVDFLEPTHSALFLDLDNDADQDLVVASGVYVLIFENTGTGHFSRRLATSSLANIRSMASADFDNDGRLDIYVCGYSSRDAAKDGVGLGRPMPYHDANNGAPNYLLANRGEWKFEDVTRAVGLDVNNRRFSYAAAWEDYDNDGDVDLYVANDFGRNNLYRNDGGRFVDVAAAAGVEDISAGMSVSWGDYNRDGFIDLYVGNMYSSAGNRITYQRQFKENDDAATRALFQRHARGNSLFENAGDGTFRDVSVQADVTEARWAWGSNFIDINNDGWDDVVVANGMVTGASDPGDL